MYKYFTEDELKCRHTGECKMDKDFMKVLDEIREECGFAFVITSAYRSPKHPIEAKKSRPGAHASGKAVDILVHMEQRKDQLREIERQHLLKEAGINQPDLRNRLGNGLNNLKHLLLGDNQNL